MNVRHERLFFTWESIMEKWILITEGSFKELPDIEIFNSESEALIVLEAFVESNDGIYTKKDKHTYINNYGNNAIGIKNINIKVN